IDPSSSDCGRARAVGRLPAPRAGRDLLLGPGSARRAAAAAGLAKAVRNCDEMMTEAGGLPDAPVDPDGEDCGGDEEGEDSERRAAAKVMKEFLLSALESLAKNKGGSEFASENRERLSTLLVHRLLEAEEQQTRRRQREGQQPGRFCPPAELAACALDGCEFEPRLSPEAECRPVAAWCRGGLRAVVHARCSAEEVAAADCEDVCWPARLLTFVSTVWHQLCLQLVSTVWHQLCLQFVSTVWQQLCLQLVSTVWHLVSAACVHCLASCVCSSCPLSGILRLQLVSTVWHLVSADCVPMQRIVSKFHRTASIFSRLPAKLCPSTRFHAAPQVELPDCHVTSISRSFDGEWAVPLPDGAACVTGRLKLFDTDSGELLRDLDSCDSVRLGGIVLSADGRLLVGKKQREPRVVQAYSMSDGSRLLNYKYESEPLGLLLPRWDRLLALLPWERQPVHLFELLVRNSVRNSMRNSVRNSLRNSMRNSVRNSLRNSVRNSLWNSLWNSVRNSVRNSLRNSMRNSVRNSLWNSLWNSVRNSMRN
uniref:HECT domain-containing protein n=1 Tax=Macrostomum lignano TaxID=282301 RepID=A0A1I8HNN0_9PLAT